MIISFGFMVIAMIVSMMIWPLIFFSQMLFENDIVATVTTRLNASVEWLFSPIFYFGGIVPLEDLFLAIGVLLTFFSWVYLIRLAFWAFSLLPFAHNARAPLSGEQKETFTVT